RAIPVHCGKGPDLDSHSIYHQRVAFVMANGIAKPGRRHVDGMRRVQAHMADLMIVVIKNGNLVRLLQDQDGATCKHEWHPSRPTLVARARKSNASERHFAELLHDLRCLRLQDRIGVIADKLEEIADAVLRWRPRVALPVYVETLEQLSGGEPRPVDQGSGRRRQWVKAGGGAVDPHAGKMRDR